MRSLLFLSVLLPASSWSCDPDAGLRGASNELAARPAPADVCEPANVRRELPIALRETSGLAWSRSGKSYLWTHNDSGNEPILYAIDSTGALLGQVTVTGALLVDWEDIAAGPCDGKTCLFIADIGDNARARAMVAIYVVPEPTPDAGKTDSAITLFAKYPEGAQDAEAIFVLPDGTIYLVTKGRQAGIALYRFPKSAQRPGSVATLERVRALWPEPRTERDRVTGAAASADGRWVAIRTYRTLFLFPTQQLIGTGEASPTRFDLSPLKERQGESVALADNGQVWLTTEAERRRDRPAMTQLKCRLGS